MKNKWRATEQSSCNCTSDGDGSPRQATVSDRQVFHSNWCSEASFQQSLTNSPALQSTVLARKEFSGKKKNPSGWMDYSANFSIIPSDLET